jgi:hypothetical protein
MEYTEGVLDFSRQEEVPAETPYVRATAGRRADRRSVRASLPPPPEANSYPPPLSISPTTTSSSESDFASPASSQASPSIYSPCSYGEELAPFPLPHLEQKGAQVAPGYIPPSAVQHFGWDPVQPAVPTYGMSGASCIEQTPAHQITQTDSTGDYVWSPQMYPDQQWDYQQSAYSQQMPPQTATTHAANANAYSANAQTASAHTAHAQTANAHSANAQTVIPHGMHQPMYAATTEAYGIYPGHAMSQTSAHPYPYQDYPAYEPTVPSYGAQRPLSAPNAVSVYGTDPVPPSRQLGAPASHMRPSSRHPRHSHSHY